MRRQEQVGGRSVEPIHADERQQEQQQQEEQAETVFFSHGSVYAVGAMLTLAVLFCAGVLAYTVRRNDMLKAEYHRLMAAIAERGSKSSRIPTESEPPETVETMGPAPRVDDATPDAILLLLTHKPISNIQHPGRTKHSPTSSPHPERETFYYDDLEGSPRHTLNSTRPTTGYHSTGTSTADPGKRKTTAIPKSPATTVKALKVVPNTTRQSTLEGRKPSTATFVSTERTFRTGNVTLAWKANASSSTYLGGDNDDDEGNDSGSDDSA